MSYFGRFQYGYNFVIIDHLVYLIHSFIAEEWDAPEQTENNRHSNVSTIEKIDIPKLLDHINGSSNVSSPVDGITAGSMSPSDSSIPCSTCTCPCGKQNDVDIIDEQQPKVEKTDLFGGEELSLIKDDASLFPRTIKSQIKEEPDSPNDLHGNQGETAILKDINLDVGTTQEKKEIGSVDDNCKQIYFQLLT